MQETDEDEIVIQLLNRVVFARIKQQQAAGPDLLLSATGVYKHAPAL
jgi:hypothetical protein